MQDLLTSLKAHSGQYSGEGLNHEGQSFTAQFQIFSSVETQGLAFNFRAISPDHSVLHTESSILGSNAKGELCLWILSSNHPVVLERTLVVQHLGPTTKLVFRFGDIQNKSIFREEVHLELKPNSIRYTYFWGMPNEEFAERSGCLMTRLN